MVLPTEPPLIVWLPPVDPPCEAVDVAMIYRSFWALSNVQPAGAEELKNIIFDPGGTASADAFCLSPPGCTATQSCRDSLEIPPESGVNVTVVSVEKVDAVIVPVTVPLLVPVSLTLRPVS